MSISEKKLNLPLKREELLNSQKPYLGIAENIADKFIKGEQIDQVELIYIRQEAIKDRDFLKGDFIINMYIELKNIKKQYENKFPRWDKGKRVKVSDKLIGEIFRNNLEKSLPVVQFCQDHRITRNKYYNILGNKYKNNLDNKRIQKIKEQILGSS